MRSTLVLACWSRLMLMDAVISTPMDLGTMLRRVKGRTYKSKREFKDDLDLFWSNCLTYNAAPVRHFHHTRRVNHLCFRAELLGPSSATMRETPSSQGRATVEEHHGSERTLRPTHPQRPPWTNTFDDPHQTQWYQRSLEISVWYPGAAALAREIYDPHPTRHAFEDEEIEGCFLSR